MRFLEVFGYIRPILLHRVFGKRTPLNVMMSLTERCNLDCRYCFVGPPKGNEMEEEEVIRIIKDMSLLGAKGIVLIGGEPLIRSDIREIISAAKGHGLHVSLVTNGILVPEKLAAVRMADSVHVSFDGRKGNHDKNRVPGSHDRAMDAIRLLKDADVKLFTRTTLTRNNMKDIDYILGLGKEMGFGCDFVLLHWAGENPRIVELLPSKNEYRRAISKIIRKKMQGYPVKTSYRALMKSLRWEDYRRTRLPGRGGCLAGRLFCSIDAQGKLSPCEMAGGASGVDVRSVGFRRAWKSLANKRLWCSDCSYLCYTEWNNELRLHK